MASLLPRGTRLYAKIKNIDGEQQRVRTDFVVGQEEAAQRWAEEQEESIARARALKPAGETGPLTITLYARAWLKKRKTKTVGDDKGRLEKHVLPRIGHVAIKDARPRHFRDLIVELKNDSTLAPKTIREISGLCHTLFNSAIIDELITENPVKYEKGVLPKKLDKDPSWRRQAIYTRTEVEQLLSDERIPIDRRVLYALKFFTGRHSEVSGLTWEQYDPVTKPLGSLAIDKTKTDVPRLIPVHPTLAKVLASWKLFGWEDLYGDKPRPMDLIVPTRNLSRRDANEAQRQLVYDLEKIGLRVKAGKSRNRRGHDLRRTLITLARGDGAIDSLLRWITHGPKPSEILDVYSSPPWESLCTEIGKLKIELREGKVIAMAANDPTSGPRDPDGTGKVQERSKILNPARMVARPGLDEEYLRPRRDSNHLSLVQGDTWREENREVEQGLVSPDGAGSESLDHAKVQSVKCACDLGIELLRITAVTPGGETGSTPTLWVGNGEDDV